MTPMPWIRTIADGDAQEPLATLYRQAIARAGKVFGIVRLMSLEPATLKASMALYGATTTSPRSPLPRWFRELVAVHVSRANHCRY